MSNVTYTLWLLNDPATNAGDCQCWFHHPEIPRAFRETRDEQFAKQALNRIQLCNPGKRYELRSA